jgi:hypothetical protein
MSLRDWGPYTAAFLTSFLICWIDLHKVAGDKVNYPVSPLVCSEPLLFLCLNGLLAAILFYIVVDSGVDIFQLQIWGHMMLRGWAAVMPSTVPTREWIDPIDRWPKSIAIGLITITTLRSKLFSLRGNSSFGIDIVYTRKRDRCVLSIQQSTLTRRQIIRDKFRGEFGDDPGFTEDFGKLLLQILAESKQTPEIVGQISDVTRIMQTKAAEGAPPREREAAAVVVQTLIRTALEYGDPLHIEKTLRHRITHKDFDIRLRWSGVFGFFLKLKDFWSALLHRMDNTLP